MNQLPNTSLQGEAPDSGAIQLEPSPFEEGFKPGTLPKFSVPDLPEDATGLSAEALSNIPTLTELVSDAPAESVVPKFNAPQPVPPLTPEEPEPPQVFNDESDESAGLEAQDSPDQADLWSEELQTRMGKLTDDIHTLNARLDRLEELNKIKVEHG